MKKIVTNEQREKIIYNYTVLKIPMKKAGAEFDFSDKIVKRILVEENIDTNGRKRKRKYNVNDNYFNVENSNMAYILGFWASDGNVHQKENRLDLELASQDLQILELIKNEIQSERPIKIYQCANGYTKNKLYFWSKNIKDKFIEYGIVPNKTYSELFHAPYKLDKKYWIDYIRGFFDGDGCVTKNQYTISFSLNCTNRKFLEDIQEYFKEYHNIRTEISTTGMKGRNIPVYRLYCYSLEAIKVYNALYTKDSLYLKRKKDKWEQLLSEK